jgi:hypothetical protein
VILLSMFFYDINKNLTGQRYIIFNITKTKKLK